MASTAGDIPEALLATLARPILEAAETARIGISVSLVEGPKVTRVYMSNVAAQILGYLPEELIGNSTYLTFAPEEVLRMEALSKQWQKGEAVPFFLESVCLKKDGTRVPVEVGYSPVQLEGKPATVAFLRDISERKKTELALAQSENLFRKLIEAAPEAVIVTRDIGNRCAYANPRYLQLVGYDTVAELAAKDLFDLVHPDDRTNLRERREEVLASGTNPSVHREYRLLRKDGGVVSVECSSLPIDFEGAPGLLTFMRDIGSRKAAQAQLSQTDRMATIGTLAGAVAHELNNPLAYIMLNLGLFERELEALIPSPEDRERVGTRLQVIRDGTSHMATIIRDLRGFCRPNSVPMAVDVRQIMESAINMAMNELRDRGHLVRDYAPVRTVVADGARLGQVFLNLLLNAAQALNEDGPSTNVIRVTLRDDDGDRVCIEVADSGHGIPPEILDRIFEPFFTTKPTGIGTGLGLSISKSIVLGMMGELTVESVVGKGSTFRVVLPATDALASCASATSTPTPAAAATPVVKPMTRACVLIVDDETALAKTLRSVLEPECDVTAVVGGAPALELLLGDAVFDAIVCDVLMPGMSGIELYEELVRKRPEAAARIIFMSGATCMPSVIDFLATIRNPRIDKPIDVPKLRAMIRETRLIIA